MTVILSAENNLTKVNIYKIFSCWELQDKSFGELGSIYN